MNKILCLIDWSYFCYFTIFGAVKKFQQKCPDEASIMIKKPEETPQDNLPNLLISDDFRRELKKSFISRCEIVDWILRENLVDVIDLAEKVDYIAVMDDSLVNSFRKTLYPEYKATRRLVKKSYDVGVLKDYINDVICPELVEKGKFIFKKLKVHGAEGDDVAACLIKNLHDKYLDIVLLASDHDFLQLSGKVRQYDLSGNEIKDKIKVKKEDVYLSGKMSLLVKILSGDSSDNIPPIMERVGKVRAWNLAKDKDSLKRLLVENQTAAKQFALNRSIIDFSRIPKDLEDRIMEEARPLLEDNEPSPRDKIAEVLFEL